ncbi:ATP-binding cassette domain-containing protein [Helicobacter saguini]|uniref:ABC transporter ATP-binding protein n=1 Tax=Helicobacter saguini TaxID=1548018 RepID=A0A347VI97_9HELI|nr:ABC transporter ATP-binding protein [Helicobacter saguini]MWV62613.1 ATP-binding cassette domain-containing protein [Helicobacter saguini]MWV66715.1 ATP-binding cassette domain-containing protein [Helicobacter saguini]MWV69065.1 ATP-binding cassette domain-containing protein [Helicobacter saguini]MWV71381.1 ATP-binding cassette domain-containing protein [Helicobacter saguini]TLD94013.1 ABC transporter ATP-binding protein [Helicobacter saguini]
MFKIIKNVTLNDTKRFYKSLALSVFGDMVGFLGIFIVIYFVSVMLKTFTNDTQVSPALMYGICISAFVYMILYYLALIPAYKANYESTYKQSAKKRLELAEHIRKLPLGFLESSNPSRLSHSLMSDFAALEGANSHLLPQLFSSLILAILVFVALSIYNFKMALALFACVPLALIILYGVRRLSSILTLRHRSAILNASNVINEYIDGITTIKANNMAGSKFERLEKTFDRLRKESIRIEVSLMPFALSVITCMGAGIGIMVIVGRNELISGEINVIEYIAILLLGSKAFVPLMTFCINFIELGYFSKAGENILALLNTPVISGSDKDVPKGNDIVLKNVSFSYGEKPVLNNINLEIKAKSSLAIIGESGCGKSTLVKLIARFYEPSSGEIYIGDCIESSLADSKGLKNIATLDYESLMQKFSMVFQKVYLFKGNVKSNLAFAKDNASEAEMLDVLKKANALEFLESNSLDSIKNTLNYSIAEGGKNLSGGQKQRLSIARSLLKDSPIILLDEITSSLDIKNEVQMQQAINALTKQKSVIIIAHKLRSVRHCDNIIVLEKTKNGSIIAEHGRHNELLERNAIYAKMWEQENTLD